MIQKQYIGLELFVQHTIQQRQKKRVCIINFLACIIGYTVCKIKGQRLANKENYGLANAKRTGNLQPNIMKNIYINQESVIEVGFNLSTTIEAIYECMLQ